jgi:antitoxin component YwqK of YwqJK toxin-antitoxin module/tetratricopeptide (TPR) repeat protein
MITSSLIAQQLPLINSGEILQNVSSLVDSGKYDLAIKELLAIPRRDTNYVRAQVRLGEMYNSNKQHDEAVAISEKALKYRSQYRASLLSVKALAFEHKKEYDQAINCLQAALKDYPFDIQLRYQLATSYHNKLDYANAVKAYYDVLEISPYSYNVHLNLGSIAMWTGHKTQAILSYGIYMALNNTDNAKLILLESICSNQAESEGVAKDKAAGVPNGFEKLDQIIRSKIAMDKKFKTEVPVDAAIVKQFEMLIKQLNTVSTNVDDPWVKTYLPVYQALRDQNLMEAFLYHILESSSIEAVKKWNSKNEKTRETFFKVVNENLEKDRSNVRVPESFGLGSKAYAEYTEENRVYGVGADSNGKKHGKWFYFDSNNEKIAEGLYENGEKRGAWKYFANTGVPSSIENVETGEVTTFNPDGGKALHYFLKNDDIEGEITFYYPCGSVSERRVHKDGKRTGKGELFFQNGSVKSDFEYADGKLSGAWIDYDVFGTVKAKGQYKNGERDGISETFWSNGKSKDKETYTDGKLDGPSEGHHDNGKLAFKGNNLNDEPTGEWVYFNRYGEQTERRLYSNGKMDHENIFNHDGKLYYKCVYHKGVITQVLYYDKDGKEMWKGGSPDGNFDVKHHYPNGQPLSEGKFKKGARDGKWTQFHRTGIVQALFNYTDGAFDGVQEEFYNNGKKKIESVYKAGKRDGYATEYYANGQKQREGWYTSNKAQQQWLSYYADGRLMEDTYLINDERIDSAYVYSPDGMITGRSFYEADENTYEESFSPLTTIYAMDIKAAGKATELKYENGSPSARYNVKCGLLEGDFARFYPDGKPFTQFSYVGGALKGAYKGFDELGNVEAGGNYRASDQAGVWTYYNVIGKSSQVARYANGKLDSTLVNYYEFGGVYYTVEYRNGKRHGLLQYFAPGGGVIAEKMFDGDQLVSFRTVGKNGQFGEWVINQPKLDIVAYHPNGVKAFEEKYDNGVITGTKRMWFPDGKLCLEYNYKDGDNEGPSTDYYPNGKVCKRSPYHLDVLDGKMEVFQENGMPLLVSEFKLGKKHGTTTVYSKGVKTKEILYHNGIPIK